MICGTLAASLSMRAGIQRKSSWHIDCMTKRRLTTLSDAG
jgi:hypothetical protein